MVEILFCKVCGRFTLKNICASCGAAAYSLKPAKYSPEDKYGHYRRLAKQELKNE